MKTFIDYLRKKNEAFGGIDMKDQFKSDAESRFIASDANLKCLRDKLSMIGVPVNFVVSDKPDEYLSLHPEVKRSDSLTLIRRQRGEHPMTCWQWLHNIGHMLAGESYSEDQELKAYFNDAKSEHVQVPQTTKKL